MRVRSDLSPMVHSFSNNITVGFDDVGSLENVKAKLRVCIE